MELVRLLCKVFCSNSGQHRKVFVRSFRVEKVALSVAEAHNIAAHFIRAVCSVESLLHRTHVKQFTEKKQRLKTEKSLLRGSFRFG